MATASRQITENHSIATIKGLIETIAKNEDNLSKLFQAKESPVSKAQLIQEKNRQDAVRNTRVRLGLPLDPPTKATEKSNEPQTYTAAVNQLISELAKDSHTDSSEIRKYIDLQLSPSDLSKNLQDQLKTMENTPTTVWGIRMPILFQLQYAGREYQFPFSFVSGMLEVALAPIIIGWLGALYATRQRELLLIAKLDNYKQAFPYILNFLPVQFGNLQRIKRADRWILNFHCVLLSSFRSLVLLVLSTPMLIGFSYSLVEMNEIIQNGMSILLNIGYALAFIMFVQAAMLVLQEWFILKNKYFFE